MSEYYQEWYGRYPVKLADPETYFTFEGESAGRFTWDTTENTNGLADPENLQDMKPREVLEYIYEDAWMEKSHSRRSYSSSLGRNLHGLRTEQ